MLVIFIVNIRNLDLNLLKIFETIWAERNLTRAAAKLGMTQPAVSNALTRLRNALGDPLFVKTIQGMTPTPRARTLAEPIHQALGLLYAGLDANRDFDFNSTSRSFVIATEDYGEVVVLPRLMDWISKAAPGVRFEIIFKTGNELWQKISDGSIDMALVYFNNRSNELDSRRLLSDTLVSLVRQDHPSVGEQLSIESYLELRHVMLATRTSSPSIIDRVLARRGLKRKIIMQIPHFVSMPLIVHKTDFICTLPKRMAQVYADNLRLKLLKLPFETPPIPIYLVWHKSSTAECGHVWLRNALLELCNRL